ncbi:MAG: alanine:cation symporter family protein [Defluviitaleaceae bacterium]|nr:alanine:cation symporter family protein [Defluviitaleaceae bacterium]
MEVITAWIDTFSWKYLIIPLLLAMSFFLTVYAKMPQFHFKKIKQALGKTTSTEQLTPVATLMIALSARIGVGTLAGTGLALAVGGPGAIFWMWVSAVLTAGASFAENTLSQRFKQGDAHHYYGGPAFYIKYGLKHQKLALIYATILIVTYTLGFVAVQINTVSTIFVKTIQVSPYVMAVILTLLTGIVITGSLTKISKLIAKIMPFIAILFFGLAAVTLIVNVAYLPTFFTEIITHAFDFHALTGGGMGAAVTTGIKRGIFSNEAGLGTGAHAAALTHHDDPREQGYIGVLGIYLTTLVSVTLVAFMLMSTGAHQHVHLTGNGIEFLHFALTQLFGTATSLILPITLFFFGFSTVITAYLYGVMNLNFLSEKKSMTLVLRLVLLLAVFLAAIGNAQFIWQLADLGVGITAMINLVALFLLRKWIN